jgi:putative ABC transport system permease protein
MARWHQMILKLALRNIIGNGWRSLINIVIISFVLIGLIWGEGMWYSWLKLAKTQQSEWEYGGGILRATSYDPFDAFTWEKGYSPLPVGARQDVQQGNIVPILFSPGMIYPQGRMMNAMIKGIPQSQRLLRFPSGALKSEDSAYVPAIIGREMSKSSKLQEGDVFTLRIKDSSGSFNALDLQVAKVMDCPVPSLDIGTVWMDLSALRDVKLLPDAATVLVLKDASLANISDKAYRYISPKEFFADLDQMVKTKVGGQTLPFGMMILLAMLAIFDTQTLAIFKRRKEIGMLSALGMTKRQIIGVFTWEGALYMVAASVFSVVAGFPLFWYFAVKGFSLPQGYDSFGVAGFSEPLKFHYPLPIVFVTLLFLFLLTLFVSWLPARKIAKLNPTVALRGK